MRRRDFLAASAVAAVASTTVRASETAARTRVGVIGHTGRGDFGHGLDTMWVGLPEVEIVGVVDLGGEKGLEAARARLNGATGFADVATMLQTAKPEIVAIAPRYIDLHRELILAAAEGGVRGLYVEKTFCRTPEEADAIVAACDRRSVKLAIAHRNRYHPALKTVDRLVRDGAIGRVLEIRARGKEDQRGGAQDLWVLGSHVLNLCTVFAGAPVACTGTLLQNGRPATSADVKEGAEGVGPIAGNALHARFETERGIPVYFDSVQNAGKKPVDFGLQLVGTTGIIDLNVDREPLCHLIPGNPFHATREPRPWIPISSAGPGQPEPIANLGRDLAGHVLAARDLIAAIHSDRQPLCNATEGRTTIEMICSVFESHRRGGQRVSFPLEQRGNPLALLS